MITELQVYWPSQGRDIGCPVPTSLLPLVSHFSVCAHPNGTDRWTDTSRFLYHVPQDAASILQLSQIQSKWSGYRKMCVKMQEAKKTVTSWKDVVILQHNLYKAKSRVLTVTWICFNLYHFHFSDSQAPIFLQNLTNWQHYLFYVTVNTKLAILKTFFRASLVA